MQVKDLVPAPYNPRKITERKLDLLGQAMREFGDLSGIVFNVQTGRMVGGHQRIKHLDPGWKIVKEAVADDLGTVAAGHIETPFGRWTYREVAWDEQKEIAANIAANRHGGEFDFPLLKDLIVQIDDGGFNLDLTGFEQTELVNIFGEPDSAEWGKALGDLPNGERAPFRQITFTVHEEQFVEIEKAISLSKSQGPFVDSPNENSNGNALSRICESFLTYAEKPAGAAAGSEE